DDTKARFLDERIDGAGQIALGRIWFEDRKSALDRHRIFLYLDQSENLLSFIGEDGARGLYRCRFQAASSGVQALDYNIAGAKHAGPIQDVRRLQCLVQQAAI